MTTSPTQSSRTIGRRLWVLVVVVVILGLSLLLSFDFSSGSFAPSAWSNLISAVQISTLVVVLALLFMWVRSRDS